MPSDEGEDLDPSEMSTEEAIRAMDENPEAVREYREQQEQDGKPGSTEGDRPVLWVSLTSAGRAVGGHDAESMAALKDWLEAELGERYDIVVADDRVRLMDREEIVEAIQELQEYAGQFAHEDALFEAASEDEGDEDGE